MRCKQYRNRLDDYLDGDMAPGLRTAFEAHAEECEKCRAATTSAREIQKALRQIPVPPMQPGFASQAIDRAIKQRNHHRHGFVAGFSSALAASLILALFIGGLVTENGQPTQQAVTPVVTISMKKPQTINLVFDVATVMDNATLSIVLPDNIEIIGFPGQHEISWKTSLQAGKNILPLPLKGMMHSTSTLIASVEQDGKKKSVRIPIRVNNGETAPQVKLAGTHTV